MARYLLMLVTTLGGCASSPPSARVAVPSGRPPSIQVPVATSLPAFVELRSGGSATFCARTEAGELWCWGVLDLPGRSDFEVHAEPVRLEGLPPLAGFTLVERTIIGWDRDGVPAMVAFDSAKGVFAVRRTIPVAASPPTTGGVHVEPPGAAPNISSASDRCLVTVNQELLCTQAWSPKIAPAFYRTAGAATAADDWCAIDPVGHAYVVSPRPLDVSRFDKLGEVTSLACWKQPDQRSDYTFEACGVGRDGNLRCTQRDVLDTLVIVSESFGVARVHRTGAQGICIARVDGGVRCIPMAHAPPSAAAMLPVLTEVDARRGVAAVTDAVCALGGDGIVRCWGISAAAALGDGSSEQLAAPVHLTSFDGADQITYDDSITCVKKGGTEVRCFGRLGSERVDPAPLTLPEPIDEMAGGHLLCVRGTKSQRWFCRDPFSSFFKGSLPSGFEPLRDKNGRTITDTIHAVAVNSGDAIEALGDAGALYTFQLSSARQPLRFKETKLDKHVVGLAGPGADRLDNGSVAFHERGLRGFHAGHERAVAGPIRAVASLCWVDGNGVLSCMNGEGTVRLAEHVSAVTQYSALTEAGGVLGIEQLPGKPPSGVHEIVGLPPMAAIAGSCGLSRDKQVWCWGRVDETDAPAMRLEPRPIGYNRRP